MCQSPLTPLVPNQHVKLNLWWGFVACQATGTIKFKEVNNLFVFSPNMCHKQKKINVWWNKIHFLLWCHFMMCYNFLMNECKTSFLYSNSSALQEIMGQENKMIFFFFLSLYDFHLLKFKRQKKSAISTRNKGYMQKEKKVAKLWIYMHLVFLSPQSTN